MRKKILIYLLTTLVSYYLTRYLLPFTPEELEQKSFKPDLPRIIQDPRILPEIEIVDPLNVRGGWQPVGWFLKRLKDLKKDVVLNRDILLPVIALCTVAVGGKYLGALSSVVTDASPVLKALPLPLARNLLSGFDSHNPKEILTSLWTTLMNPTLPFEEKLLVLKKSLSALVLATKSGFSRKKILVSAIVLASAVVFTSSPALAGLTLCIQDLLTEAGFKKAMVNYIIDIYQEYNAPFPMELVDLAQKAELIISK